MATAKKCEELIPSNLMPREVENRDVELLIR